MRRFGPGRMLQSSPSVVETRRNGIIAFLRDSGGEASMKDICIWLGYSWPAELEAARQIMKAMERQNMVVKSIRPNHETRVAYYSLPTGERT